MIVQHFQHLFNCRDVEGVLPAMNQVSSLGWVQHWQHAISLRPRWVIHNLPAAPDCTVSWHSMTVQSDLPCTLTWSFSASLWTLQVYLALNEAAAFKTNLTASLQAPATASWTELSDRCADTLNM